MANQQVFYNENIYKVPVFYGVVSDTHTRICTDFSDVNVIKENPKNKFKTVLCKKFESASDARDWVNEQVHKKKSSVTTFVSIDQFEKILKNSQDLKDEKERAHKDEKDKRSKTPELESVSSSQRSLPREKSSALLAGSAKKRKVSDK